MANLSLSAPAGAITQSGPITASTLNTQSQGATTLANPDNQISGRVDMTAGGPIRLWASGALNLGAINAGANPIEINAGHDILAEVTGDLRLNGSSFTAGNDIFINMLGANSTLYLNDAAGLPRSFLWAKAPGTIHLDYPARTAGGLVVDGVATDPRTFVPVAGGSGLFYSAAMMPATPGAGLDMSYSGVTITAATKVTPGAVEPMVATISASSPVVTRSADTTGQLPPDATDAQLHASGSPGGIFASEQTIGGSAGNFAGSEEEDDRDQTDQKTGLKKKADKPAVKKMGACNSSEK